MTAFLHDIFSQKVRHPEPVEGSALTDVRESQRKLILRQAQDDSALVCGFFLVPKLHLGTQLSMQLHCSP
jgi:hypothetical protein